ncbi:hypothetical protein ACJX0J_030014, partial [Zea mays]
LSILFCMSFVKTVHFFNSIWLINFDEDTYVNTSVITSFSIQESSSSFIKCQLIFIVSIIVDIVSIISVPYQIVGQYRQMQFFHAIMLLYDLGSILCCAGCIEEIQITPY